MLSCGKIRRERDPERSSWCTENVLFLELGGECRVGFCANLSCTENVCIFDLHISITTFFFFFFNQVNATLRAETALAVWVPLGRDTKSREYAVLIDADYRVETRLLQPMGSRELWPKARPFTECLLVLRTPQDRSGGNYSSPVTDQTTKTGLEKYWNSLGHTTR